MAFKKSYKKKRVNKKNKQLYYRSYRPKIAQKPELKQYKDTLANLGLSTISTSGSHVVLSNKIEKGLDNYQRIGTQIAITSIWMRVKFTNGDDTNTIRMLLFKDRKYGTTTYPSINDFVDLDNLIIYKDKLAVTNAMFTGAKTPNYKTIGIKFKKPLYINYNVGANTAVTPLILYFVSDSGVLTHPSIEGPLIINYYDV